MEHDRSRLLIHSQQPKVEQEAKTTQAQGQ